MQLILTQSIIEGIHIKMSSQTETPANENIADVKEITQAFKIDETTIAALETNLSNDLPTSVISNEIMLMKEKSRYNIANTNDDKNYCIPKDNHVENTNSMVSQTVAIGTSCAQDTLESECNTQNREITNDDKPSQNKTIDSEHFMQNNTKNLEHFTKIKLEIVYSDEPLLENSMISLHQSKDIITNTNTNTVSSQDSDMIPDISAQSEKIHEASIVITDIIDSDPEKLKDESKHTELTSTDASKYPDDIEMGDEILKLSEEPLSILTNNGLNSIVEQNCLDSEDVTMDDIDSSDSKKQLTEDTVPIKMDIEILPANWTDENIMPQESQNEKCTETNKEESLLIQTDEKIIPLETEESKNVDVDKRQSLSTQTKENKISQETLHPEPEDKPSLPLNNGDNEMSLNSNTLELNKTDKEVLSFKIDENTFSAKSEDSEAKNSVEMTDETFLPVHQTLSSDHSATKHETKEETLTTISESTIKTVFVATDNTEKLKNHTSEINVNNVQETDTVLVSEAESTTVFVATNNTEELKERPSEINIKYMQETDTSLVSESAATNVFDATDNTEKLKENKSEMKLNSFQETDTPSVHSLSICAQDKVMDDSKHLDNNSMEVDEIEINDLKKENLKDVSNTGDSPSNELLSKVSIVQGTKSDMTSDIGAEQKVAEVPVEKKEIVFENKDVANLLTENLNMDRTAVTLNTDAEQKVTEDLVENTLEKETILENKVAENILIENLNLDTNLTTTVENKNSADCIGKEVKDLTKEDQEKIEIIDEDDVKIVDYDDTTKIQQKLNSPEHQEPKTLPVVCTLSNTLDILSDDEEEASNVATNIPQPSPTEKQCIDLDDDDDIMLIEEEANIKDKSEVLCNEIDTEAKQSHKVDVGASEEQATVVTDLAPNIVEKNFPTENISSMEVDAVPDTENKPEAENKKPEKPLLPQNFLKTAKKNLASMTRHELEDFCILRIVESIVDRSNLSDIKTKMKTMAQNLEDYKKRATMMTKQNRDLQVVLKSVQEEQKKRLNTPIIPLKITRSVGMQVLMNDKLDPRRKAAIPNPVQATPTAGTSGRPIRGTQNVKQIKPPASPVNIPVPRKVPVNISPSKPVTNTPTNSIGNKSATPNTIGVRIPSPVQKAPEKRTHSRMQATSVTVDLTDDEPPAKINNKNTPTQPVRVVPQQNLLAPPRQFPPITNNARKVYIPISGPGNQQIRPGQTYVMKNMSNPGPKPAQRMPIPRPQQQNSRPKQLANRHPAPLPESMKQYTPSTWKALPPAPDLKLSKVENGIVISWKIDGYPEGDYETIASYQLYAYQETTAPPCTALWKKIGDVKALPLPMACTLTQFMAGFKYYFAVRAVDIKCRLGPFSLPGSILLLNKV